MPIYQFRCVECGSVQEPILPMEDRNEPRTCKCGGVERRIFEVPAPPIIAQTGKDQVLGILNQEDPTRDFPGGDKHRARYEQVMGKSLDYVTPVEERVFQGFGSTPKGG